MSKSKAGQIIGGIILICAIIGGSSIGVLANYIPVQSSFAKNAWRSGLNVVIFIFPALIEYLSLRKTVSYSKLLTLKEYAILLVTLTC